MLLIGSWSQVRDWLSLFTNQRVTNSTLCLTIIIYYDSQLIDAYAVSFSGTGVFDGVF